MTGNVEPGSTTPASGEEHQTLLAGTSIINNVVYLHGKSVAAPATLAETFRLLERQPDSMAWIGLYRPAEAQLLSAAEQLGLHDLAVEDAVTAHQRPKLERYGDTLFVVLRSASYRDDAEEVDFGELHLFVGPNFVLTVRHSEAPDLAVVRQRVENQPHLLRLGPEAVLYAVLDAVVDGYTPVVAGLQKTTSRRSRPRCSAAIRTPLGGSTSCLARWSSSSVPAGRSWRCWTASRPGSSNMASTRNCNDTSGM